MAWHAGGLRFHCTMCGNCCTGQPGHVWITPEEEQEIATHLGLAPKKFRKRYLRLVGDRLSLLEKPSRDCIFLTDDHRCAIHTVKPRQCLTYPFWARNIASSKDWIETGQRCPGIGDGPLFSTDELELIVDEDTPKDLIWKLLSKPPD